MLSVDLLFKQLVTLREFLGVSNHSFNFFLGQAALVICDRDALGLARALLGGADGQYGVLIDFKGNLNLGNTSSGGRDSGNVEFAELVVILNKGAFAFEYSNGYGGLLVLIRGKCLGLLGGDNCASGDDLGHHTTNGLNTKSKWSNINEE